MKTSVILFFFLALGVSSAIGVDFDSEVLPILKNRCGKCHMDGETKGQVALDKDKIGKEMNDGSIVPGDVKASDLHWTMTLDPDDDLAMPPKGKRVPQEEIDLIAKWIEEGAKLGGSGSPDSGSMTDTGMGDSMSGDSMSGDSMSGDSMSGGGAKKPWKGIFKNNKGMQVEATITRLDGDRAILILPDGKEYRYPIAMFAPETKEIVEKFKSGALTQ